MPRRSTAGRRRVRLELRAEPGADVFVAGTFNNWNPKKNRLERHENDGAYHVALLLPKGRHEYKFVVNDVWCVDPDCEEWAPNEMGSLNSVLNVE